MCSCKRQCSLRRCWLEVVRLREAFRSSLGDGLRERRPCGKSVCGLIRSLTKYAFLRSLGSDQFILKNVRVPLCGYGKVLVCGWHLQQQCGAEVLAGLVFPFCVNDAPSQSECLHLTGADAAIDPLL